MNRLELEQQIKKEGLKRKIKITGCRIYDRGNCLDFYPEIENNYAESWIYSHQVDELISDLAPLERSHKVNKIDLDSSRSDLFNIGDKIEVDNVWIRLNAGEDEPENLIKIGSACGQFRQGWVKGKVFETPEQNDRALGIKFDRDIYIESEECGWIGNVTNLEKLIKEGGIKKIEAGQPIWSGTHRWEIRKP